jgi:excinuclease ABC subunit A
LDKYLMKLEQGHIIDWRHAIYSGLPGAECVDMGAIGIVNRICSSCGGKRYDAAILEVLYRGHSIWNVLEMTPVEALEVFREHKSITLMLQTLIQVGRTTSRWASPLRRLAEARHSGLSWQGNTVIVIEHDTAVLTYCDWMVTMGPGW